jgi:putative ABC transport system permease protein
VFQDIRYAFRQFARRPGFAIVAILTLGIGIAANTAIVSAARASLFLPLPFEHEERLVRIYLTNETGGPRLSLRTAVFQAVRDRAQAFDALVAQRFTEYALATDGGPERVIGIAVSEGWAETLGVTPALGRTFTPEEEARGEDAGVLLLSHGAWQRRFGGAASALGSVMLLDGRPHSVVGILRPGFNYPYNAELWVPMRVEGVQRGVWAFNAPARLRPGWTVGRALEHLRAVSAAAAADVRDLQPGMVLTAVPIRDTLVGDEGRTLLALLGAVGFFLLLVCANLATLLHAKAVGRSREFALRTAIGATRVRLFRQLLVESVVLALLGGVAGIVLASFGTSLVQPLLPRSLSNFGTVATLDGSVLAIAVLLAVLSGVLFGLAPALRLARSRVDLALQSSARSIGARGGRSLEQILVVGELAIALTLLSGIGLMLRDFQRLQSADLGYEPTGMTTFTVSLSREQYPTAESRLAFATTAEAALAAIPGVPTVGGTSMFPSARGGSLAEVVVEGREPSPGVRILVHDRLVTPGFLDALGVPLLRGRTITARDGASGDPVIVISAGLAQRLLPDENPLGRRVRNARDGDAAPWMTVVGVVGDVREFYDVDVTWYRPFAQHAHLRSAAELVFAVRGEQSQLSVPTLRQAIAAVDPGLPVYDVISATGLYAESFGRQGQAALLGSFLAAFALAVAGMGIYGSISYGVSRRTREIGVRMALGSDRETVLRGIVAEGGRLVMAGLAIGLAGALVLARFLSAALTEIGAFDLATFLGSSAVLATVGMVAALLPAIRATKIDPMEALGRD